MAKHFSNKNLINEELRSMISRSVVLQTLINITYNIQDVHNKFQVYIVFGDGPA